MWFTILLFVDLWDDSKFTLITGNYHYSSNENKEKRYCVHCETYGLSYQELNTEPTLNQNLKIVRYYQMPRTGFNKLLALQFTHQSTASRKTNSKDSLKFQI